MKRLSSIVLLLFLGLGVMSQTDTQEYKTIFKKDRIKHGAYVGLGFNYAKVNDDNAIFIGAKGGWVVDHKVVIGFAGYGFLNDRHFNAGNDDINTNLAGGYGGFMLEYIILPHAPVHISIPLLLGAGGIAHTNNWDMNFWDEYSNKADAFFVMEPGIEVEFNLIKFMRLSLGLNYRITTNIQLENTDKNALNGLSTGITLKFGKF